MKQVFSGKTELDAHEVRLLLESEGIKAFVDGESAAFTNFSFTPSSEPRVLVNDDDFGRAQSLIAVFAQRPRPNAILGTWKCSTCGETCEEQFDACWNCSAHRPETLIEASRAKADPLTKDVFVDSTDLTTQSVLDEPSVSLGAYPWHYWIEVVAVLLVFQHFYATIYAIDVIFPRLFETDSFVLESLLNIAGDLVSVIFTLWIVRRSGEPLSTFGLVKPRWLWDLLGAGILYLVGVRLIFVANGVLTDLLHSYFHRQDVYKLLENYYDYLSPHGGFELLIAILLVTCIGFAEELVMRGYLIPRFEQLFYSTFAAIVVSAILFGALHWYQSIDGIWCAFVLGMFFGGVFAYFRRLWPLALTHAMWDFVAILRDGSMY